MRCAEVPPELSSDVVSRWTTEAQGADQADYPALLQRVLIGMTPADATLLPGETNASVVAVVGPAGVGKTSAVVKLAARYGVSGRRPAQLICFDNCRIGGAAQLRTYAAILGIGFQAVDTPGALRQALEEHRNKGLVLIDTAGYGAGDDEEAAELSHLLASRPDIQVHLALSASVKPADLRRVADRFAGFRPSRLLFTRLDETSTFGPVWAEAIRLATPVSFLSDGPRIPEDLREATSELVAGYILDAFPNWNADGEGSHGDAQPLDAIGPAAGMSGDEVRRSDGAMAA